MSTPIPMVLFCPACGGQHIDADNSDEVRIAAAERGFVHGSRDWENFIEEREWTNPPHRTHQCAHCRDDQGWPFQWRPADVETVGVRALAVVCGSYLSDLAATRAAQAPSLLPPDCGPGMWGAAVRKVFAAARGDAYLGSLPSTWLDAMRNILLDVGKR